MLSYVLQWYCKNEQIPPTSGVAGENVYLYFAMPKSRLCFKIVENTKSNLESATCNADRSSPATPERTFLLPQYRLLFSI